MIENPQIKITTKSTRQVFIEILTMLALAILTMTATFCLCYLMLKSVGFN